MKTKIIISIAAVVLITIAAVFWMESCRKPVGPIEILSTEEIIKELEEANTPEESKFAINHLIEKVGLGFQLEGSSYEYYQLNEQQINDLAFVQSQYNNGIAFETNGEFYDSIRFASNILSGQLSNQWFLTGNYNTTVNHLRDEAINALSDKEKPDNALILTIMSKYGEIPEYIEPLIIEDSLSPVQNFLFSTWLTNNYSEFNITQRGSFWCKVKCVVKGVICITICYFTNGYDCIEDCVDGTVDCWKKCHDQGGGG